MYNDTEYVLVWVLANFMVKGQFVNISDFVGQAISAGNYSAVLL